MWNHFRLCWQFLNDWHSWFWVDNRLWQVGSSILWHWPYLLIWLSVFWVSCRLRTLAFIVKEENVCWHQLCPHRKRVNIFVCQPFSIFIHWCQIESLLELFIFEASKCLQSFLLILKYFYLLRYCWIEYCGISACYMTRLYWTANAPVSKPVVHNQGERAQVLGGCGQTFRVCLSLCFSQHNL